MKRHNLLKQIFPREGEEAVDMLREHWRNHRGATILFFTLCFNLIIAPAIYAATGENIARPNAYAIGILILVTLSLSVYLFLVIFQPERF
ncbi:potassium-transporting ATPase subunit F [Oscillatoria salina]|uniref:potassium-transporting ATPase subunit F n=1 Tax=Oscillatoria salina TaxID=331517 RepID=UPI0013BB3B83|nr:potassium-transporting ATPase subunit F [Oscillatoria salina]MBZ8182419.1 potassium-transporting ATPase subunit F [Oscillatoria salina IIICB1]NET90919.1 potassium-transporting ATPase subunit F [Kamptonema sp. SIO1D9]